MTRYVKEDNVSSTCMCIWFSSRNTGTRCSRTGIWTGSNGYSATYAKASTAGSRNSMGNGSCPPARFVPADRGGQPTRQLAEGSVKPVHETRLPRTRSTLLAGETAMERKLLRGNRRRCPARHVETIHRKPEPTSMTKVKAFHHRPKGRRPHARKR